MKFIERELIELHIALGIIDENKQSYDCKMLSEKLVKELKNKIFKLMKEK